MGKQTKKAPVSANLATLDKKNYVVEQVDSARIQVTYKNWARWYVYRNIDAQGALHPKASRVMWNPHTHQRLFISHPNRMLMMGYKLGKRLLKQVPVDAQQTLPGIR